VKLFPVCEVEVKIAVQVGRFTVYDVDKVRWTCAQFVLDRFKKVIA
jgi:hypothetical protein